MRSGGDYAHRSDNAGSMSLPTFRREQIQKEQRQ